MEGLVGAAVALCTGILQNHEHGQGDGVSLLVVLLLDAAHDEGVRILNACVLQHVWLGWVSLDQLESAGPLCLLLWQPLHRTAASRITMADLVVCCHSVVYISLT